MDEVCREGMFWNNTNIIKNAKKPAEIPTGDFLSERKLKNLDNIKLCSDCKRFVSGQNFQRHQKSCSGERPVAISPVVMDHESHHVLGRGEASSHQPGGDDP